MPDSLRKEFAKVGLKAALSEEGLKEFSKKKFSNGKKAFREKEIKHISDVNRFLSYFFPLTYFLFALWLAGVFLIKQPKIMIYSGLLTISIIVFLG